MIAMVTNQTRDARCESSRCLGAISPCCADSLASLGAISSAADRVCTLAVMSGGLVLPSPYSGAGEGAGLFLERSPPHPSPPPEYRGRGKGLYPRCFRTASRQKTDFDRNPPVQP